jgi:prefoldin alpha subunit
VSQEQEQQLRRLVTEIKMMEGTAQILEQRLQLVGANISELRLAQGSLEDLKKVEVGSNLLVPVGGGIFMNARLGDTGRVIVGVGADVSVEMEHEAAVNDVAERLQELEKAHESAQEQLGQILSQLETHNRMAERLSVQIQNALQGAK